MSTFGFTVKQPGTGGDWLGIIKYDARAGRMFRVDRVPDTTGNAISQSADITASFKALLDCENVYVGWIEFQPGMAPSMALAPRNDPDHPFPTAPSTNHRQGVRVLVKLSGDCAQGTPAVRELAGTSISLLGALEKVVAEYDRQKGANPGKLPVIVLDGMPMPVESGSGARRSTNYHPAFKIVGWAARGDFTFVPPDRGVAPGNGAASNGAAQPRTAAPATGAQRAAPPQAAAQQDFASDFG